MTVLVILALAFGGFAAVKEGWEDRTWLPCVAGVFLWGVAGVFAWGVITGELPA